MRSSSCTLSNDLLVGLSAATKGATDAVVKCKIQPAQLMTVVSWYTYPVVYLFPMLGINAAHAVVSIQVGYCASTNLPMPSPTSRGSCHNESCSDRRNLCHIGVGLFLKHVFCPDCVGVGLSLKHVFCPYPDFGLSLTSCCEKCCSCEGFSYCSLPIFILFALSPLMGA